MHRAYLLCLSLALIVAAVVVGAAGAERSAAAETQATPHGVARDVLRVSEVVAPPGSAQVPSETQAAAQPILLDVYSINSGGSQEVQAGDLQLGVSIGEPAVGVTQAGPLRVELGYWYMVSEAYVCPVALSGDVNMSGSIATSDIIYLVNYIFRAAAEPLPCLGAGDVNCDGRVVTSDIVYLVNYVLKAMSPPCDVCSLMPATWPCP